jgi:hypothetical protein
MKNRGQYFFHGLLLKETNANVSLAAFHPHSCLYIITILNSLYEVHFTKNKMVLSKQVFQFKLNGNC